MKIGILNSITPQEEAEFGVREFESFATFFAQVPNEFTLEEYRVTEGCFPESPQACDAYLLTGSPKGVYDDESWIGQLHEFVQDAYQADRKLVGICFGHQVLAHALGGHSEKSEKGWGMGRRQAEILVTKEWMTPALEISNLYFCHQDQVKQLPPEAELLGSNEFCPNMMFAIGNKVFGTQAHPEFEDWVMSNAVDYFRGKLPDTFMDEVESTIIPNSTDGQILAQWIVNFLHS